MGVAICTNVEQPEPWQRSNWYPVTPTLSVDAVQTRLIWLVLTAVAVRFKGTDGATVSAVAAVAMFEYALELLFVSLARTR